MDYNKIVSVMNGLSVQALLVSDGFNMRYLSGFSGGEGYVYLSKKQKVIITDSRYTVQAEQESGDFKILQSAQNELELLNGLLREDGVSRLGYESEVVTASEYFKWRAALSVDELVPAGNEITKLRWVKENWELLRIKEAEAIGDRAFSHILNIIKPGMTELSIAANLEFFMKENGAERLSFDTIVASGIHSAMPHAQPTGKKIEMGDFITMDFGCVYQGYCSDMTRTIVMGKASPEQKKIYKVVLEAQNAALDYIREGRIGQDTDRVAREVIEKAGYGDSFGHGLGHSVGLYIHEEPRFSPRDDSVICEGMVVTVEPGIYVKGFGGVRIEDLVVVTGSGCENFTHSRKDLIELFSV